METKYIKDLTELSEIDDSDLLVVEDMSDSGDVGTRKITKANLLKSVTDSVSDLSKAITNETTRAKGVESDIQSQVDELKETVDRHVFGFRRYNTSSDTSTRIEYIEEANGYKPFTYDFSNNVADEGDWSDFISTICRPVMLYKGGGVAYELDRNNTTLKADGTASDISNTSFDGNAMVEFSEYKWVQRYTIGEYDYVSFANYQKNDTFKNYAFIGEDGTLKDHFYFSMFEGYYDNTCMRSIADVSPMTDATAPTEVSRAKANGDNWNIGAWSQLNYIWDLLTMIGKSDNLQATFGQGVSDVSAKVNTGGSKSYGAWYGASSGDKNVRTLYIEDLWGNIWDRYNGLVNDNGTIKVRMTPPYPTPTDSSPTYSDYVSVGTTPSEGYVKSALCNEYGFIPTATGGSATTYYCDYFYKNDSGVKFLRVGGYWSLGAKCGRYCHVSSASSISYSYLGSRLLKI